MEPIGEGNILEFESAESFSNKSLETFSLVFCAAFPFQLGR